MWAKWIKASACQSTATDMWLLGVTGKSKMESWGAQIDFFPLGPDKKSHLTASHGSVQKVKNRVCRVIGLVALFLCCYCRADRELYFECKNNVFSNKKPVTE